MDNILSVVVTFLFELTTWIVSIILIPVDAIINTAIPQASVAIHDFFTWVNGMIAQFLDFINWFFYVLGIKPETWQLIMTVCSTLLLVWIFLYPTKLIFSTFRGMKD